jgi:hypothetical protein
MLYRTQAEAEARCKKAGSNPEGTMAFVGHPTYESLVGNIAKVLRLHKLGFEIVPDQLLSLCCENFFSLMRGKVRPDCGSDQMSHLKGGNQAQICFKLGLESHP